MSAATHRASLTAESARLASRVADAARVADARLEVAVADIFLSQPGRLDDRTRAATLRLAEATVCAIEQRIAGETARDLTMADRHEAAVILDTNRSLAWPRLLEAGLMRDADVIGELIAQARVDLLDESLAAMRAPDAAPTLVATLVERGAPAQRVAAVAYLVADGTRRGGASGRRAMLSATLHARVAWWVAAALREQLGATAGPVGDRALADATHRCIADHADDGGAVDPAAAALVRALAPSPAERAELMVRALDGARVALFVALLADAVSIEANDARALVLDAASDGLWLALRAAGLPHDALARAGFLLCEADRERDLSLLIETLDTLAALDPAVAAAAVAGLRLPRDFREAARALARCPPA